MFARTSLPTRRVAARATDAPTDAPAPAPAAPRAGPPAGSVFYRGVAYENEAAFQAAVASGATDVKNVKEEFVAVAAPSLADVMAFAGPAPEIANGRACMVATLAALAAELKTDTPILAQAAQEPTLVVLAALLVIVGTLAPLVQNVDVVPPFAWAKPDIEMKVGRVAMLGLVAWVIVEGVKGGAVF